MNGFQIAIDPPAYQKFSLDHLSELHSGYFGEAKPGLWGINVVKKGVHI
jgi:hypothetical protein